MLLRLHFVCVSWKKWKTGKKKKNTRRREGWGSGVFSLEKPLYVTYLWKSSTDSWWKRNFRLGTGYERRLISVNRIWVGWFYRWGCVEDSWLVYCMCLECRLECSVRFRYDWVLSVRDVVDWKPPKVFFSSFLVPDTPRSFFVWNGVGWFCVHRYGRILFLTFTPKRVRHCQRHINRVWVSSLSGTRSIVCAFSPGCDSTCIIRFVKSPIDCLFPKLSGSVLLGCYSSSSSLNE